MTVELMPRQMVRFTLPVGLVDDGGTLHRQGVMYLATGCDEFWVMRDPRRQDNPAYGLLCRLGRAIVELGTLETITPELLEGLFLADFLYLRQFYRDINGFGGAVIPLGEI